MIDPTHPGFALPPVAPATGPFCTAPFLAAAGRHEPGEALVAAADDAFIPLRVVDGVICFIGDPEVTDYHSPRGEGTESLIARVAAEKPGTEFRLDSLPEEAAKPLAAGLEGAGWEVRTEPDEVAAVLHLPASFDQYLADVGKKERHEIRRKRRRYERMLGGAELETHRGVGWAFAEFVRLHRLAPGDKGTFLTEAREAFFGELAGLEGWRLDLLRGEGETATAVVFGYADASGYYLYNSAFDPELGDASPGVVLLGAMIERAIAEGLSRFDFLKGDETYKFRLGAEERPLFAIGAVPPGGTA